jgi:protein YibB
LSASDLVTIVTAFKDLGRENWHKTAPFKRFPRWLSRSSSEYFENFARLCELPNPIVVFAHRDMHEDLISIRQDLQLYDIEEVWVKHENILTRIAEIQNSKYFRRFVVSPKMPEYWNAEYVYINYLKPAFVASATETIGTQGTFAWVDFGYARKRIRCAETGGWKFRTHEKINFFALNTADFSKEIFEVIKSGDVLIQGGMIVGPGVLWQDLYIDWFRKISELLALGLVDDDQTIMLLLYKAEPNRFVLQQFTSSNWFVGFDNIVP